MANELRSETAQRPVALPRRAQLLILLILALVISAALGLGRVTHLFGALFEANVEQATEPPVAMPGVFRPTPAQLVMFKVTPVTTLTFRTERVTDGKIAINNDKTTPVFSP